MIRSYRIGRGITCEIIVDHKSVSRLHAELSVAEDGRYYLTDCNSRAGPFKMDNGEWVRVRQSFVEPTQPLKLGEQELTAEEALERRSTKTSQLVQ